MFELFEGQSFPTVGPGFLKTAGPARGHRSDEDAVAFFFSNELAVMYSRQVRLPRDVQLQGACCRARVFFRYLDGLQYSNKAPPASVLPPAAAELL